MGKQCQIEHGREYTLCVSRSGWSLTFGPTWARSADTFENVADPSVSTLYEADRSTHSMS